MIAAVRREIAVLATAVALAFTPAPAGAHEQAFSYVDLRLAERRCEIKLTVHRKDAATAIGLGAPESLASPGAVAEQSPALVRTLAPRLTVRANGHAMQVAWTGCAARPERRAVELTGDIAWDRMPGQIGVTARISPENSLHETYVNVYQGDRLLRQEVLTHDRPAFDMYTSGAEGAWAVGVTFVRAGIHHIFIGPDHILFVIGLLLMGGGLGRILKIISGFTVAHSITLALAALGLVTPPARVIEPLIALSIVFVGVANLRSHQGARDRRGWIAFGFGLVHGFGFASVLRQFGLPREALGVSLAAFNVGVEIGQACIVLAALPLLALLRLRSERLSMRAVAAGSWGVVIAGGWWFVQRVFFTSG